MHTKLDAKVRSTIKTLSLLIFVAAMSGCGTSGQLVCPDQYRQVDPLPALPKDRMAKPQYQQRLSEEFFGSAQTQTTQSDGIKPN